MASKNKTQASSRWANVKAIQTVSLDTDLNDSDCATSNESKRGRIQCVILQLATDQNLPKFHDTSSSLSLTCMRNLVGFSRIWSVHSESKSNQVQKVQHSPAPWANMSKQSISFNEVVCQEKTHDSGALSRIHSKSQRTTTQKKDTHCKLRSRIITSEVIQPHVKSYNITDYSVEDLMHALNTKNKKQLKKIMHRAEHYTDMFTGHWFNRYFITAFEILGDSFGMYLSCKPHNKPLDVSEILRYSKKKDSTVFSWIYNKHQSLYSIYGKQPTLADIQETVNIFCRYDSPEFISSVRNHVSIDWNSVFKTCLNAKSIKVFESILDYLTRKQMQSFITSVKFPNAGNIVFKYRLYKTEPCEYFNIMRTPNTFDIYKLFIDNNLFTELQVCKMAMVNRNGDLVNKYFNPQVFFEFPNETINYFEHRLTELLVVLEPWFFTMDFQYDDILFNTFCKQYSRVNELSQLQKDFVEHCIYYKGVEFNCSRCTTRNFSMYCNCTVGFRNRHSKLIEAFEIKRQIELTEILDKCLTECNVCDDIIFDCLLPCLYYIPKKTKKSVYETFKTWKEYDDSF